MFDSNLHDFISGFFVLALSSAKLAVELTSRDCSNLNFSVEKPGDLKARLHA